ncbi:MAG TPA: S16 family serine protease [Pseudolysinimonas sp.]|nr:S16 family serine protease [Pseudolysinimonas sp.]
MSQFPDDAEWERPDERFRDVRHSPAPLAGWILMIGAIAGTVVLGTLPAPYVLESPGPVYDTIGDIEIAGDTVPVIDIDGEKTYPTSGSLDMLTVTLRGSRQNPLSWVDLAIAWFDPTRALLPLDLVYPDGQTEQESDEESAADMADSQKEAVAAALTELGIDYTSIVVVGSTLPGFPAEGVLLAGDRILTVDGDPIDGVTELSAALAARPVGSTYAIGIERDGEKQVVELTTEASPDKPDMPIIGIQPRASYDFPFDVTVNLGDVGGPSAGTMLALGVYDKLTPGELTGGERIAGTGTIAADGRVGAIGGIRQKMYGAKSAGADWFLAPESNCDEVAGHVPGGLEVFAMSTLDDALEIVETIAGGGDTSGLPRCG